MCNLTDYGALYGQPAYTLYEQHGSRPFCSGKDTWPASAKDRDIGQITDIGMYLILKGMQTSIHDCGRYRNRTYDPFRVKEVR